MPCHSTTFVLSLVTDCEPPWEGTLGKPSPHSWILHSLAQGPWTRSFLPQGCTPWLSSDDDFGDSVEEWSGASVLQTWCTCGLSTSCLDALGKSSSWVAPPGVKVTPLVSYAQHVHYYHEHPSFFPLMGVGGAATAFPSSLRVPQEALEDPWLGTSGTSSQAAE